MSLIVVLCFVCSVCVVSVHAAGIPTSLGFAERGIEAYRDGWHYYYGGKGEVRNGVRVSDCAGLLYSYFSDMGVGGCMGSCTAQVTYNCVMSCKLNGRIPRIHGLSVTMYDTVDPGSGLYGHVGIYIGGGEVCDNSDYNVNMIRKGVFERNWTEWHLFDNGLRYPVNGWYEFDGRYVHYTNYEYDVDTSFDGYAIDGKGFADGIDVPLSNEWASASEVKSYLLSQGWSDDGGTVVDFHPNASVTGIGVNVRSRPGTYGSRVAIVTKGNSIEVVSSAEGERIGNEAVWYKVKLRTGVEGYILRTYVQLDDEIVDKLSVPTLSIDGNTIVLSCSDDADVYYTTDGSDPVSAGKLYEEPFYGFGCTCRFVACNDAGCSDVVTKSICSNGTVFDDFTFTDWFAYSVDECVRLGLFNGTGNGKFSPGMNMTRAQFVTVLARYARADLDVYSGHSDFDDVGVGSYYTPAVNWASENGVVSGIGNRKFQPEGVITREQACVMFARYFGLGTSDPELFADDAKISDWARDGVYACRSRGLINGVGGNRFDPRGVLSRAQGATVFANLD